MRRGRNPRTYATNPETGFITGLEYRTSTGVQPKALDRLGVNKNSWFRQRPTENGWRTHAAFIARSLRILWEALL